VSNAVRKEATYDDVLNAPPHVVAEIINGTLHTHPRPRARHGKAAGSLFVELSYPFGKGRGGPGGWVFFMEPEVHLGRHIVVPDVAGWTTQRLPNYSGDAPFFEVPPNWLCEVLSPSTEALDRSEKMRIYAAHGVQYVWLINPAVRLLEIHQLEGKAFRQVGIHTNDAVVRAEPFDAIELQLAEFWVP
jgi:Uma2 family endonuclease